MVAVKSISDFSSNEAISQNAASLNVSLFRLANYLSTNYGRHSEANMMNHVVEEIAGLLDVSGLVVALVQNDQSSNSLKERELFISSGLLSPDIEIFKGFLADTLLNEAMEKRSTLAYSNTKTSILKEKIGSGSLTRIGSLLAIPMMFRNKVIGVLIAVRGEVGAFREGQHRTFERISKFIAQDILESKLYYEAILDFSSGLYHRQAMLSFLRRELERASRYQAPLSISFLDVDGYSYMEPSLLRDRSGPIVKQLSSRFLDEVRQADICGRISEDTFLIIHPMSTYKNSVYVAKRIQKSLRDTPLIVQENKISLSLSIGIAEFMPGNDDLSILLSRADTAMQGAKAAGGNYIVTDR